MFWMPFFSSASWLGLAVAVFSLLPWLTNATPWLPTVPRSPDWRFCRERIALGLPGGADGAGGVGHLGAPCTGAGDTAGGRAKIEHADDVLQPDFAAEVSAGQAGAGS